MLKNLPYHQVVNVDKFMKDRLSLDVKLAAPFAEQDERKIKEDLTRLSHYLYQHYKGRKFCRVFICYYLPGDVIDNGAWATGHFNPELKVRRENNKEFSKQGGVEDF